MSVAGGRRLRHRAWGGLHAGGLNQACCIQLCNNLPSPPPARVTAACSQARKRRGVPPHTVAVCGGLARAADGAGRPAKLTTTAGVPHGHVLPRRCWPGAWIQSLASAVPIRRPMPRVPARCCATHHGLRLRLLLQPSMAMRELGFQHRRAACPRHLQGLAQSARLCGASAHRRIANQCTPDAVCGGTRSGRPRT